MKKKLIYTMTFLLGGAFLFSSCDDMLNVDSNRVEYEYGDWSANDSVYSVLGILKAVQEVGDRQVLINELRADLLTLNEAKAVVDIQELSRSEFKPETNEYLDVKDYYAIINNCNIYLSRVDVDLDKNGVKFMMPEYVAVKSVRAWTYLQLAINHNYVPYFTEPILTNADAENVVNAPKLSRDEIIDKLIADILPYENPSAFPMPSWENDGKVIYVEYGPATSLKKIELETKRLFVPVRMLLGELYLWRGDYKNAAKFFYSQIVGSGTNETAPKYVDNSNRATYGAKKGKSFNNSFISMYSTEDLEKNISKFFTVIPYASLAKQGKVSELASVFSPQGEVGAAQVLASPAILSLAKRQVYSYCEFNANDPEKVEYQEYSGPSYEYAGDLRIKATTNSQRGNDDQKTEYKNIISKFNFESGSFGIDEELKPSNIGTAFIVLQRAEHAYIRLAEALVGLEREGYVGAMELAMTILKSGVKDKYRLLKNPVYATGTDTVPVIKDRKDSLGNILLDSLGIALKDTTFRYDEYEYLASCTDSLNYNFSADNFKSNKGLHSRGSGDSKQNKYYALNDTCIARYLGLIEMDGLVEKISGEITYEDSLKYITDLIIDELALEFAWEGTRFGDLVRFAKATGDNDVLAKRIAGRAFENEATYRNRNNEYQFDPELYSIMLDESNWYLPLPGNVVSPAAASEDEE